jgi:hypothetical protein
MMDNDSRMGRRVELGQRCISHRSNYLIAYRGFPDADSIGLCEDRPLPRSGSTIGPGPHSRSQRFSSELTHSMAERKSSAAPLKPSFVLI